MKTNRTTPQWLVDKMWEIIKVHTNELPKYHIYVLEPSAGIGNLLKPSDINHDRFTFDAIELNKEKFDILSNSIVGNIYHNDFLKLELDKTYDAVIAAPPFNNNVDLEHIKKMFRTLSKNGIIVTLTSPYWITNNELHQVEFRNWLSDKNHKIEMLPDMTFVEKNKTVPTCILIIKK